MSSFDTRFLCVSVSGLDVFYREAGDPQNPTLLLHNPCRGRAKPIQVHGTTV